MDSTKNLDKQIKLAKAILGHWSKHDPVARDLAAVVLDLHDHISGCGEPPDQWKAGLNANSSGADVCVDDIIDIYRCKVCSLHNCTCLDLSHE